ncbi:MAG: TIR domain-containing protein [Eubacteriales bacterium]|nr:TIR domain-containing protein [Eubacteriales bacterium]
MQHASCVLILAGVYSTYSKWINIEINLAQEMGKRIIAIEPWGSERTSTVVKSNANKVVKWNTSSIVNAIKGY